MMTLHFFFFSCLYNSRAIVSNEDLRPSSSWMDLWSHDFWGTPLDHAGSHQSWRPLCVLSFRLNYFWSGTHAKVSHKKFSSLLSFNELGRSRINGKKLLIFLWCLIVRPSGPTRKSNDCVIAHDREGEGGRKIKTNVRGVGREEISAITWFNFRENGATYFVHVAWITIWGDAWMIESTKVHSFFFTLSCNERSFSNIQECQ